MVVAPGKTLADYLVPSHTSRLSNLIRDGILIIGFSLFTALCAQASFYLPFSPVPVTLQTLAVLLTAAVLGRVRGTLAMLAYVGEGTAHLPFFAGGTSGFPLLSGGYLIGYIIVAFIVGWLCERGWDRSLFTAALAMVFGSLIIYLVGASWLGVVLYVDTPLARVLHVYGHVNILTTLNFGVIPFLIGDMLKLVAATLLLPTTWRIVRKIKPEQTQ